MINPVEIPKSEEVNCSAKLTCSKKCSKPYWRVDCKTFWPPTETCKLVKDTGEVVAGHVSNGDFHWESPSPPLVPVTAPKNGTINTPVGCTIPLLINWLKLPPADTG